MKRKVLNPFLFVALLVLAVGLACGIDFGTKTPEPPQPIIQPTSAPIQPTSAPLQQPTQPEIVQPTNPPASTQAPSPSTSQYYTEEWNDGFGNWSQQVKLNSDEGDVNKAKVFVENDRLVFDLDKWLIAYVFYDPYQYTDVKIQVRVENRGTNNKNNVMLVCRVSSEGHYLVTIANSGLFSLFSYDGAKDTYTRMDSSGSTKIKSGKEINDYTLVCKDKTLTLYINGEESRKYTDNKFVWRQGQVGVGVASEDLPVKIEFDYVTISEP